MSASLIEKDIQCRLGLSFAQFAMYCHVSAMNYSSQLCMRHRVEWNFALTAGTKTIKGTFNLKKFNQIIYARSVLDTYLQ